MKSIIANIDLRQ